MAGVRKIVLVEGGVGYGGSWRVTYGGKFGGTPARTGHYSMDISFINMKSA